MGKNKTKKQQQQQQTGNGHNLKNLQSDAPKNQNIIHEVIKLEEVNNNIHEKDQNHFTATTIASISTTAEVIVENNLPVENSQVQINDSQKIIEEDYPQSEFSEINLSVNAEVPTVPLSKYVEEDFHEELVPPVETNHCKENETTLSIPYDEKINISLTPLPPLTPVFDPLNDQLPESPVDLGCKTTSPEKFFKESSPNSEKQAPIIRSFIRRPLLFTQQALVHVLEILQFLNDDLKYEFGFPSQDIKSYSPFLKTWIIPHFVDRNPLLRDYISVGWSQQNSDLRAQEEELFINRENCSATSISSTSEFLLLMACLNLTFACIWTGFLLTSTLMNGCLFHAISKSFSMFWKMSIWCFSFFLWILLLPITLPLSICKKIVLFLFPEINKKRQQGVSPSVCGTL